MYEVGVGAPRVGRHLKASLGRGAGRHIFVADLGAEACSLAAAKVYKLGPADAIGESQVVIHFRDPIQA